MTDARFFRLRPSAPPWGDYGAVLVHGLAGKNLPDGTLSLMRTGPFVPPITFPGRKNVVVTDAFKRALEGSRLSGMTFGNVTLAKTTFSRWETWDRGAKMVPFRQWNMFDKTARQPPLTPSSGEPEDYILAARQDNSVARAIGVLWLVRMADYGALPASAEHTDRKRRHLRVAFDKAQAPDMFCINGRFMIVSEAAREFLESQVLQWVAFDDVSVEQSDG